MRKLLIASLTAILFLIIGLVIFQMTRKEDMPEDISVADSFYSVCCVDGNSNDCESFGDLRYTCIPGGECVDRGPGSVACPANRPVLIASGNTCTPENTSWGEWSVCTTSGETCSRSRNCVGQATCGGVDVCGGQSQQVEACDPSLCGLDLEAQIEVSVEDDVPELIEPEQQTTSCQGGQAFDPVSGECKIVVGECGVCGSSDTICSNGLSCDSNNCVRPNGTSNCYAVKNFK